MYTEIIKLLKQIKNKKITITPIPDELINSNTVPLNRQKLTESIDEFTKQMTNKTNGLNKTRGFRKIPIIPSDTSDPSNQQSSSGGGKKKRTNKGSKKKKRSRKGSKRKRTRQNPTRQNAH